VETLATLLEGQPADLLLCNILAPVIEALCPAFHTVLAADGMAYSAPLWIRLRACNRPWQQRAGGLNSAPSEGAGRCWCCIRHTDL
jgi:hypothetical protein